MINENTWTQKPWGWKSRNQRVSSIACAERILLDDAKSYLPATDVSVKICHCHGAQQSGKWWKKMEIRYGSDQQIVQEDYLTTSLHVLVDGCWHGHEHLKIWVRQNLYQFWIFPYHISVLVCIVDTILPKSWYIGVRQLSQRQRCCMGFKDLSQTTPHLENKLPFLSIELELFKHIVDLC